ncbi:MAG: 2Fe-2S iron-sulfur cluster-binding protein [Alphaproteobacteria bacterium]
MTGGSVRVSIAGSDLAFDCAPGDTVLRAGLRAGIGMPYECSVGSCGTCRFELVEGEVETVWDAAPGLTERDKARGRRLACQSRPAGACIIKLRPMPGNVPPVAPQRHSARLVGTRALTRDMREFAFRAEGEAAFVPGQYALIEFGPEIGPRAYSMSNLPNADGEWRFVVRLVPDGKGTSALFGAAEGQAFELDGPYGLACYRTSERDILCVAGGSGLSPMLSIVRAAARDAHRRIRLFYGGRTPEDLCAEAEIRSLPGYGERIACVSAVSDLEAAALGGFTGETGFIHEVVERALGDALKDHEIYFSGPPAMADAMQKMLVLGRKVPVEQIHFDRFY